MALAATMRRRVCCCLSARLAADGWRARRLELDWRLLGLVPSYMKYECSHLGRLLPQRGRSHPQHRRGAPVAAYAHGGSRASLHALPRPTSPNAPPIDEAGTWRGWGPYGRPSRWVTRLMLISNAWAPEWGGFAPYCAPRRGRHPWGERRRGGRPRVFLCGAGCCHLPGAS
jgi:hypothetical protein